MATIRLTPTTLYNAAGTSYLTVTNQDNMMTDTDSTTYGTVTNVYTSTSNRYVYLRGFNFSAIPSNARVESFTVKLKANESNLSTSSSYRPRICNGTTTLTGSSSTISTSVNTISFTGVTTAWDTIEGYGSNFGIRINVRRSSSSTQGYVNIYGAEIEVEYSVPATVTSTLSGNGTIDPSGATSVYSGEEYELHITPTNSSDTVTVTNNGTDVTSQLIPAGTQTITDEQVLGAYTLVSGSFNSGSDWFSGREGEGYDTTNTTSTNYYSSGSGTTVVFTYETPISVPSGATITECYFKVNGHAESTSNASEYMCAQLYTGDTALSEELNFKDVGTSNSTQTVQATTMPTAAQCANLKIRCRLGYYGGAINGATVYVSYTATVNYITYKYTVTSDATIAVTISGGGQTTLLWAKNGSTWESYSKAYIKVNGTWVQQSSLTNIFNSSTKYRRGN